MEISGRGLTVGEAAPDFEEQLLPRRKMNVAGHEITVAGVPATISFLMREAAPGHQEQLLPRWK
jgi:hypothetical protein